jgi:hypothetical protein
VTDIPIPSPEEWERINADFERLRQEHEKLREAILAHRNVWAELEIALSALLYEVLRVQPRSSRIAYAIYYSPTGFEARSTLVDNAVIQLIAENAGLAALGSPWRLLCRQVDRARSIRNAIAHGTQTTLHIGDKRYARLTSPAFDVIRVARIISKGQVPGISADVLSDAVKRARRLCDCVDDVNRAVASFHDEPSAFDAHITSLKQRLKHEENG